VAEPVGSYGALRIIDILRIIGGVLVVDSSLTNFSTLVSLIAVPVIWIVVVVVQ
jgi:hypothetical protein